MESFWARMQVELLNRKRWNTRLELANAISEYLEIFHNRQRRHSSIGMLSAIEYELRHADTTARDQPTDRAKPGRRESSHQTQGDSLRIFRVSRFEESKVHFGRKGFRITSPGRVTTL